jgi:hypothetical protein
MWGSPHFYGMNGQYKKTGRNWSSAIFDDGRGPTTSLSIASSGNNRQIFLAPHRCSSLVRRFARLLAHGHILEEERGQDGSCAEDENRYKAMLDGYSKREPERLEHLVEQVLRLLHSLHGHLVSYHSVLWARWDLRLRALGREALRCAHHRRTVGRIHEHLRAGRELQSCGREPVRNGSRQTTGDIAGQSVVHDGADDGHAQDRAELAKVPHRAGADAQARARQRILRRYGQYREERAQTNARNHHEDDRLQQACRWRHARQQEHTGGHDERAQDGD